ncbi:ATP-binding Cassette (ABC) superfamily [Phytophthora infestans T30-4]|uniref:ATP-binding Cassette (ABC) superfamily n=1 Tax=Phytophthora infestans (strain T30-4) TaxID=403677 RepID=D0NIM6_PHYIT|nr:ATP-binding Cassette (ABC) superfamily [Phytophthora infestans T30-4]EEY59360.1 ATP-binding Cassette (ABC) superfamily [Phytophthora infestans T30-4]|eukprot:XP_002900970.1 ATP-binding Cassette (ABC) superfamily [Phytophthora infestans T30-4]
MAWTLYRRLKPANSSRNCTTLCRMKASDCRLVTSPSCSSPRNEPQRPRPRCTSSSSALWTCTGAHLRTTSHEWACRCFWRYFSVSRLLRPSTRRTRA